MTDGEKPYRGGNRVPPADLSSCLEEIWRRDSRRVLATLIRLVGDFDRAEEAMGEAFAAALERWSVEGLPENPCAWLVSAGRFRAIDALRRRAAADVALSGRPGDSAGSQPLEPDEFADDRLRLIFACCHPALPPESRLVLILREVCGLTTEEIARSLLQSAPAVAQRIVRAKTKLRDEGMPYDLPSLADLPTRLEVVLQVLYLVFNEGYAASSGPSLTRADLAVEAIRLGRLLAELAPEPEVMGLLGLMLLHDSRRGARISPEGELVRIDDQDRSLWDHSKIREGSALVEKALASGRFGPYTLQAAIAAVHAEAARPGDTDWAQIVGLYDLLLARLPTPIVALNRAAALAERDGAEAGLRLVDAILARGELVDHHLAQATRADLCRRCGRLDEARQAYRRALDLAGLDAERRFLQARLLELEPPDPTEG